MNGKIIHNLTGRAEYVNSAKFSSDEKYIVTASEADTVLHVYNSSSQLNNIIKISRGVAKIWETGTGKLRWNLAGHGGSINSVEFSPDGKYVVTASRDNTAIMWETVTGKRLWYLGQHTGWVNSAHFSSDGKNVATVSADKTVKIWDAGNGSILWNLTGHSGQINSAQFSPDGKYIATSSWDNTAKIWKLSNGKLAQNLSKHTFSVNAVNFSANSKYLATAAGDNTVKIWETTNGTLIEDLKGHREDVVTVQFSPDGKYVVSASKDKTAKIWETPGGKKLWDLTGHTSQLLSAQFSPNGKHVLTASHDNAKIWDVASGDLVWDLTTQTGKFHSAQYSSSGKYILTVFNDLKITLWNAQTGKELISWISIDATDWVVTHPSGLFDASPGAMDKLYFVQGLDIIDFNQLKERYYEPGLWKKVMAGEELRNVEAFTKIELPPDIELSEVNAQGMLTIKAINRGGGIGEISVLVNGKEVLEDARPKGSNSNAADLTIQLPVTKFAAQFWPGDDNYIAVKAWNAGHWVVSRGKMVTYKVPKKADIKPAIHVIACGISDYTGTELDLKFAAKDAEDVAQALTLGAKKLFGTEAAYVHTLTTSGSKETWPTKANIINTFKNVSSAAKSTDVIVLYLAGHGITWGGQDGDFYYLTQDAYTGVTSAYNDPAIREKTTLSSAELVELFKLIPAQKQVMIVDACGSGKAVDNLIAKRDIPSSTLRALDRMKDRTGMHIITGCAADAVSYEASQFGQGILTYSLLEGIRGAALRDEKFVDVNQLFQYAQERVPVLVAGVGGIQTPQVFSPYGAQSFDIGEVSTEDKKKIPIAKVRPVFVRSSLINKNTLDDNLQLGKLLDEKLNDIAARGTDAELIFVNVQDYPDGCKLSGIYEQVGDSYKADVKIKCGDKEQKQTITASSASDFVQKMVEVTKKTGAVGYQRIRLLYFEKFSSLEIRVKSSVSACAMITRSNGSR